MGHERKRSPVPQHDNRARAEASVPGKDTRLMQWRDVQQLAVPLEYVPPPPLHCESPVQCKKAGSDWPNYLHVPELDGPREVQQNGAAGAETDIVAVKEAAARGINGSGGRLSHAESIARRFGEHGDTVQNIKAHTGSAADQATSMMGATAYATGNDVVLASGAAGDLHTQAHEAAHVVQQARGVSLYGGVGQVGDAYEAQADAVADRVVAGQSAADLLPSGAARTSAAARIGSHAVQRKPSSKALHEIQMPPDEVGVQTGDDYVDDGLHCDKADGDPNCFLRPGQREILMNEFTDRVGAAFKWMAFAVQQLLDDEKYKPEKKEFSVWNTLLVEGIELILTGGVSKALKFAEAHASEMIQKIGDAERKEAMESLLKTSMHSVEKATELAIHTTKEAFAFSVEEAGPDAEEVADKAAVIGLLDHIINSLPFMEQNIKEQVPASIRTDQQLLLNWGAWDVRNGHSIQDYKEALKIKLIAFRTSGLTQTGAVPIHHGWNFENTRVFWLDNHKTLLGLFKKTTIRPDNEHRMQDKGEEWEYQGPVEKQFYDEAIALHAQRWNEPITVYQDPKAAPKKYIYVDPTTGQSEEL